MTLKVLAAAALLGLPAGALAKAAPESTSQPRTIEGTVARVAGQQLWLQDDQGALYPLQLPPQLTANQNGQRIAVKQLPFGTPVRATSQVVNGQQVARNIEVESTAPPPGLQPPAPVPNR